MGECAHCGTPLTEVGTRYCSQCWRDKDMLREIVATLEREVEQLRETNETAAVCQKHIDEFTRDGCLVCDAEAARAEGRREGLEDAANIVEAGAYCYRVKGSEWCHPSGSDCDAHAYAAAIRFLAEGGDDGE